MAQPIELARRARARRRRKRQFDFSRQLSTLNTKAVQWNWYWLIIFSQNLQRVFTILHRQHHVARAARAVLESTDVISVELPSLSGIVFDRSRPYMRQLFSLRYAAHIVVVTLVCIVTLGGRNLFISTARDANSSTIVPQPAGLDFIIPHQFEEAGESSLIGLSVPEVRSLDEQLLPIFAEQHTLAEGETLGQIAEFYHVSIASIVWSNDLVSQPVLALGERLRIPRMNGVPHVIAEGETLTSLATLFHVKPDAITLLKPNDVALGQSLPVGREVFIPGGVREYPAEFLAQQGGEGGLAAMHVIAAGRVQAADTNLRTGPSQDYPRVSYLDAGEQMILLARHENWVKADNGADLVGWVRADLIGVSDALLATLEETNDFPPPPPRWVWPTRGTITSPFGWRTVPWRMFHDGLDIANRSGTKIYAARAGHVFEAGWCRGFGYCVKIDHGDGITTIYGHMLKRPSVSVGDIVNAGDLIGLMGSTYDASGGGYSTGVHLHFTVKVNGKAVNPLNFLP